MSETIWPAEDIEALGACPLCGSGKRTLRHAALVDRIFFAAPGSWQLWQCDDCTAGYLDPRPSMSSIGRAYSSYYTHDQALPEAPAAERLGFFQRLKRAALHDFLNARFGYRLRPALPPGRLLFALRPGKARDAAEMVRHLPAPQPGDRLLDIGCGNGAFLLLARDRLGYAAEGTELDGVAAARGRARGLKIHAASLPGMNLPPQSFTQVTLNHVLEHTHDPVAALREVLSVLVPGGRVWLQVPNLNGASHARFGADSRLLEPPRHLVMFTPDALLGALRAAGFTGIERLPIENPAPMMFTAGWRISERIDPASPQAPAPPADIAAAGLAARRNFGGIAEEAEFITMTGLRPADV
jgi:SAM-dependent methyltransferase